MVASTGSSRPGRQPTAARFRAVFGREPSARELALFRSTHHALALGAPARVRRAAARLISRL